MIVISSKFALSIFIKLFGFLDFRILMKSMPKVVLISDTVLHSWVGIGDMWK